MEIEAKFSIPDRETFERLNQTSSMIGYGLSDKRIKNVQDHYLDTPSRSILAQGYACRRREQSGLIVITLKGLGSAQGAIHRREELEVQLPKIQPPQAWPPGPLRERVLQFIGPEPLQTLFILHQKRHVRHVQRDQVTVAELSLDKVWLEIEDRRTEYFELEIELLGQGQADDLTALADHVQQQWSLRPEPLSKFERGLAFAGLITTK